MKMTLKKHVPEVLQIEAAECGAASLCMILGYYGKYVELSEMRRDCKVSRDGSRMNLIMEAAEKHGLKCDAYRAPLFLLDNRQFPLIVFWDFYHFVVLESLDDKEAVICDPAVGRRRMSREEFSEHYSNAALEFHKTDEFKPGGKPFSSAKTVMKFLKGSKRGIVYLSILIIMLNLIGVLIPGMTTLFVDYYLPMKGNTSMQSYFTIFACLVMLQFLVLFARKRIIINFERLESATMNSSVILKLLKLPMYYFQSRSHSTLVQRLSSIDKLAEFLSAKLVPIVLGLAFSIIYLVMLFYYSALMGILIFVIVAGVVVLLIKLTSITKTSMIKSVNEQNTFFGNIVQNIRLFDTIKSTAQEEQAIRNSVTSYIEFEGCMQEAKAWMALISSIPVAVPLILQAVTIVLGCGLILEGYMTLGTVLACQSLAMSTYLPVAEFIAEYNNFQTQEANVRGLYDIQVEEVDPIAARDVESTDEASYSSIELKNVTFGYDTAKPPIVKNINIEVTPGKSLAIVGGSGSGKSTILRLIEGLYVPVEGQIFFGDTPIELTARASLSSSISVVSQSPSVFFGTVRDNITLFDRVIPVTEIEAAAKDACILDDISAHKDGFNEIIDPSNCAYSGGQIQRLMIARALLRKPEILIMDEGTSALDPIVEEQVMNNIKSRGITLIIVAHRLSTIRDCDEIVVLEKGEIVERGTHEKLLGDGYNVYRQLVMSDEKGR